MLAILITAAAATFAFGAGPDEVDRILGAPGKDLPGEVRRYAWPRTDLQVDVAGIRIEPALALGSWAAFHGPGNDASVMGDLALLGTEVAPVARALETAGFEILAIHNHLIGETPRIVYLHYGARGAAATLARGLRSALEKSATPLTASPAPAPPSADAEQVFAKIQEALGRRGSMAGRVLQVGVPRMEPVREGGMEVPPSMGMAESMNFEIAGGRVAATGDFVLTALHSHMLRESPRLFFLHFWGVGTAEAVAGALKSALSRIAVVSAEGGPKR
jgi:hypothetical protein